MERAREQRIMETIKKEEEKIKQEDLVIKEWTEENNNKMGNICDLHYELCCTAQVKVTQKLSL